MNAKTKAGVQKQISSCFVHSGKKICLLIPNEITRRSFLCDYRTVEKFSRLLVGWVGLLNSKYIRLIGKKNYYAVNFVCLHYHRNFKKCRLLEKGLFRKFFLL